MSERDVRSKGTATVETEHRRMGRGGGKRLGGDAHDEQVATPEPPAGATHARVRYGEGTTVNMGNFESWRCDVAVELPCRPTTQSIERTLAFAQEFVEAKIAAEADKMREKRDA